MFIHEKVFYNKGELYKDTLETAIKDSNVFKTSVNSNTGVTSQYFSVNSTDLVKSQYDIFSMKEYMEGGVIKKALKKYYKTSEMTEYVGESGLLYSPPTNIDVCDEIDFIFAYGEAVYDGEEEIEVFFRAKNYTHLKSIASYYNLPEPLADDNDFDTATYKWFRTPFPQHPINAYCMSSLKFKSGVASMLKVYMFREQTA